MKIAQAARDLETRLSGNGNVPRPTVVRLPRELEWPKIDKPLTDMWIRGHLIVLAVISSLLAETARYNSG